MFTVVISCVNSHPKKITRKLGSFHVSSKTKNLEKV